MVTKITTWGRNGLIDWLMQRITALWIGGYTLFILCFLMMHPHLTYLQWQALFSCAWVRFLTIATLIFILIHAWIGLWIVFTDYIKCPRLRLGLQCGVIGLLLGYLFWSILILWS